MTLKAQMAADAAVFFNKTEFAEDATYNGTSLEMGAIFIRGESQGDGNYLTNDGSAYQARITVARSDVPEPEAGKIIVDQYGVNWQVQLILKSDDISHTLGCVANQSVFGR